MKTNIHFWSYLAQFILEWEMFQSKVVNKLKTRILCSGGNSGNSENVNAFELGKSLFSGGTPSADWDKFQCLVPTKYSLLWTGG